MDKPPKDYGLTLNTPLWRPRRWRIVYRVTPEQWGDCDHGERVIAIDPSLSPAEQLVVLQHEIGHAVDGYEEDKANAREHGTIHGLRLLLERHGDELFESITEGQLWRRKAKRRKS